MYIPQYPIPNTKKGHQKIPFLLTSLHNSDLQSILKASIYSIFLNLSNLSSIYPHIILNVSNFSQVWAEDKTFPCLVFNSHCHFQRPDRKCLQSLAITLFILNISNKVDK